MKRGKCKVRPNMNCVATLHCYKMNYLTNHSCSGCCKEYIESLKTNAYTRGEKSSSGMRLMPD